MVREVDVGTIGVAPRDDGGGPKGPRDDGGPKGPRIEGGGPKGPRDGSSGLIVGALVRMFFCTNKNSF